MYIFYNLLIALCCLIFGYLVGSFPNAIVIGKIFFHQDPRNYGSGNAGGTNAGRLWGKKIGLLVIILDMVKTIAPLWIAWAILTQTGMKDWTYGGEILIWDAPLYYYLTALGTAFGHCWPIYVHFKGGKAASNFMGVTLGTSWICFLFDIFYFLILKIKKYVSLAGIIMAIIQIIVSWLLLGLAYIMKANGATDAFAFGFPMWGWGYCLSLGDRGGWEFPTIITVMAVIVIIRHASNIKRIKEGSERKIKWMK